MLSSNQNPSSTLKVIGIGNAGCNIIAKLLPEIADGVELIVMNTNTVRYHPCPQKIHLDCGGFNENPSCLGRDVALYSGYRIIQALDGAPAVLLVAGLGGNCGTYVSPIIAEFAKHMGMIVMSLMTLPFYWEGKKCTAKAKKGLRILCPFTDSILALPNDILIKNVDEPLSLAISFDRSDDMVLRWIHYLIKLWKLSDTGQSL